MKPELKHCPFCGGHAQYGGDEMAGFYVSCEECQASSRLIFPSKVDPYFELGNAWNYRSMTFKGQAELSKEIQDYISRRRKQFTPVKPSDLELFVDFLLRN